MEIIVGVFGASLGIVFWAWVVSTAVALTTGSRNLILQSYSMKGGAAGASTSVELRGRREGLLTFVLTLIGLSPTTLLRIDRREVVCTSTGLFGTSSQAIPVDRVPQVMYGVRKPLELVIVAGLVGLIGMAGWAAALYRFDLVAVFGVAIVMAVFAGLPLLLYYLNKRFFIRICTVGGTPVALSFKPNVIEGVDLNLDRAMALAKAVRNLILDGGQRSSGASEVVDDGPEEQAQDEDEFLPPDPPDDEAEEPDPAPRNTFETNPRNILLAAQEKIRAGQRDEAIAMLRYVSRQFPRTPEAEQARKSLERAGLVP